MMRFTARERIIAIFLAIAVFLTFSTFVHPLQTGATIGYSPDGGDETEPPPTIGSSGDEHSEDDDEDEDEGQDNDDQGLITGEDDEAASGIEEDWSAPDPDPSEDSDDNTLTLGMSGGVMSAAVTAARFEELKAWVDSTSGDLYIYLDGDIEMKDHVIVKPDRKVIIDGRNLYSIDQVTSWRFGGEARSSITLKDVTVIGRHNYGIIQSYGEYGTGVFENVIYSGPQPYYGSAKHCEMVVRGGRYDIRRQVGTSVVPEEFSQCAYVTFEGGITEITHAMGDGNHNAVFFYENGDSGKTHLKLTKGAQVKVTTGNYVLYTGIGYIPVSIEVGSRFEIAAPAFHRTESHRIASLAVEDNAYFSYRESGSPNSGGTIQELFVNGDMTIGGNSVFLYESSVGIRTEGAVALLSPKIVSIYGEQSAFYSSANWAVSGVNAVNYWGKASPWPQPAHDKATNWPDYIWNTWVEDKGESGEPEIYRIGPAFSFSTVKGNVESGGEITDALDSGASLKGTLRLDTTAKRVVMGNINPYEVEKVNTAKDAVYGRVVCDDLMVQYSGNDGETYTISGPGFPLGFGGNPKPQSGHLLTVVANMGGLRGVVKAGSTGTLELIAAPEKIYYGEHKIPATTTVYEREYCSSQNEDGKMLIQVSDSRGELSGPWKILLEVGDGQVPDRERLPPSALFFRAHNNQEYSLSEGSVVVYNQAEAIEHNVRYDLVWDNSHGLLAKAVPGELHPGKYATILNWSLQTVPDEA